jgi:hypothetical protein
VLPVVDGLHAHAEQPREIHGRKTQAFSKRDETFGDKACLSLIGNLGLVVLPRRGFR